MAEEGHLEVGVSGVAGAGVVRHHGEREGGRGRLEVELLLQEEDARADLARRRLDPEVSAVVAVPDLEADLSGESRG